MRVENGESTAAVKRWIETVVVDLNLCPFASRELVSGRVRFVSTDAVDPGALLQDLADEVAHLDDHPDVETSLLVHRDALTDFLAYNDFLDLADELLRNLSREGVYQVASFHPEYQFADTQFGDPENYSNRSPYPLLHILREASVSRAVDAYPDVDEIPVRNVARLTQLGADHLQALVKACK